MPCRSHSTERVHLYCEMIGLLQGFESPLILWAHALLLSTSPHVCAYRWRHDLPESDGRQMLVEESIVVRRSISRSTRSMAFDDARAGDCAGDKAWMGNYSQPVKPRATARHLPGPGCATEVARSSLLVTAQMAQGSAKREAREG